MSADTTRPLISFVVPSYEMAPYLELTLESLTHVAKRAPEVEFEIVVVDDGSTDDTQSIVAAARSRLPMLRCVRRERDARSCRALARNTGARASRGEYLVFLDSGVMVRPGMLRALAQAWAAERREDDAVRGDAASDVLVISTLGLFAWRFSPDCDALRARFRSLSLESLEQTFDTIAQEPAWCERRQALFTFTDNDLSRLPAPWLLSWTAALGVPARLFEAAGGFDENFLGWGAEDCDLGLGLAQAGARFRAFTSDPVLHVPHPTEPFEERRRIHRANARKLCTKRPTREGELFAVLEDPMVVNLFALRLDRADLEQLLPPWDAEMAAVAADYLARTPEPLLLSVPWTPLSARFPEATWGVPNRKLYGRLSGTQRKMLSLGVCSNEPPASRAVVVLTDLLRLLPAPLQIAGLDEALRIGQEVVLLCSGRGPGWPESSAVQRELEGWSFTSVDNLAARIAPAGIVLTDATASRTSPLQRYVVTRRAAVAQ